MLKRVVSSINKTSSILVIYDIDRIVERNTKHNKTYSKTYVIWCNMKARCFNPNSGGYRWYGARGITVCGQWKNSFQCFLEDMGECPENLTLERIDCNKNYCKENCRWMPAVIQQRNKRNNLMLEYLGRKLCLVEWAEIVGINQQTLHTRLRLGWDVKKTLTTPVRQKGRNAPKITSNIDT